MKETRLQTIRRTRSDDPDIIYLLAMLGYKRNKVSRDDEIFRLVSLGESLSTIASKHGISRQRVYQIVRQRSLPCVGCAHSLHPAFECQECECDVDRRSFNRNRIPSTEAGGR